MGVEYTLRDSVFRAFLQNPNLGPSDMAEKLNANYNSVKAIFAQLCGDGLLNREGRGNYTPNIPMIIVSLIDRIEGLEKMIR